MVARAVTRAWQASLAASPPTDRSSTPEVLDNVRSSPGVWQRPVEAGNVRAASGVRDATDVRDAADARIAANDDTDDDPSIEIDKRDDIVPRRPGAAGPIPDESFWSSHLFWKGIVVGAVIVLLVKTVIAVQAPHGVDWYGF